jgi:hypothetical protein
VVKKELANVLLFLSGGISEVRSNVVEMRLPALCVRVVPRLEVHGAGRVAGRGRETGTSGPEAAISCRQRTGPVVRYSERMRFARLLLT